VGPVSQRKQVKLLWPFRQVKALAE